MLARAIHAEKQYIVGMRKNLDTQVNKDVRLVQAAPFFAVED
jgi:hypothetical protein